MNDDVMSAGLERVNFNPPLKNKPSICKRGYFASRSRPSVHRRGDAARWGFCAFEERPLC